MTGVLLLAPGGSLLLHEANDIKQQRRITTLLCVLCGSLRSHALTSFFNAEIAKDRRGRSRNISEIFISIALDHSRFITFFGKRFAGDAILAFDPLAQIDELAPFRTEGTKRIVFPVG